MMADTIPKASGLNDYSLEQVALQRRQKLADLLREQSMVSSPTEMVSGRAVKQSPINGLARLFQAYAAGKIDKETMQGQRELADRLRSDRSADLR